MTQKDNFVRNHLPAADERPELLFELPELQFPDRLNAAGELLDCQVNAGCGDKLAVIGDSERWTYRELLAIANRIAHVLIDDFNVVPGNRVLLRGPNSPWLMACWLAVLKAGGVAVTTMPLLRARDLAPIISKARISLALCNAGLEAELADAQSLAGIPGRIIQFGNSSAPEELQLRMASKSATFTNVDCAADDPALIAFTSGTTGQPKGCVHGHRDVLAMGHCFSKHVLRPTPDDIFIGSPSFAFTFGLGALLVFPLMAGASTVLLEKGSPGDLAAGIQKYRATICFTSPTGYRGLLGMLPDYDLSSLRRCVSAGEHLPLSVFESWEKAMGQRLIDGIGATEMLHIFISAADEMIRPGATGRVVPGYRACVLDDDGRPAGPGVVGRLAVKGPTGCHYLDDARQRSYVVEGWNVTGDLYRVDEDGYFWFVSRADDMIVSAGYNISGPEVEQALIEHPAVLECAVVAAPDEQRGNIAKAYVVLAGTAEATPLLVRELQDFVKGRIAPYKYPRQISFVDELPKTPTGKVQRSRLREMAHADEGKHDAIGASKTV